MSIARNIFINHANVWSRFSFIVSQDIYIRIYKRNCIAKFSRGSSFSAGFANNLYMRFLPSFDFSFLFFLFSLCCFRNSFENYYIDLCFYVFPASSYIHSISLSIILLTVFLVAPNRDDKKASVTPIDNRTRRERTEGTREKRTRRFFDEVVRRSRFVYKCMYIYIYIFVNNLFEMKVKLSVGETD